MKFLLQRNVNSKQLSEEEQNLKQILDRRGIEYIVSDSSIVDGVGDFTPVGSIPFIEAHLQKYYNVPQICPLEIPKFLRKPEILQRKYDIIRVKDLPENGTYFLKLVDRLKILSYLGFTDHLRATRKPYEFVAISDILDQQLIDGEYRIFVFDGHRVGNPNYDLSTKQVDFSFVDKIIELMNENFPIKTYTFDVGYYNDKMFLIEVHFVSGVGTYGFHEDCLAEMYYQTYEFLKSKQHIDIINNRSLIW